MATFLTTKKMAPELAARVDASVRGRRGGAAIVRPRAVSIARAAAALVVLFVAACAIHVRRQERAQLESARQALLGAVAAKRASLGAGDLDAPSKVESWLARSAGAYEGDFVAGELRAPGAWNALLAREAVYVRAPMTALKDAASVARAASASTKDALLLCLVAPPDSRAERAFLAKARAACSTEILARTTNVHGIGEAERGLSFLRPAWSEAIASSTRVDEIDALRRAFERAPIDEATRAARATLLLAAIDEEGDGSGPTELDGERPHEVRVHLVDLSTTRTLVRVRRRVDPSGISAAARATHASGIDGCALAMDVRDALADGRAKR